MGTGISRLEIVLEQDEGQHELRPLSAGSLLKGKVVIELSDPLTVADTTKNCADGDHDGNKSPPALELRLYGKEKVCMNRRKSTKTRGSTGGVAQKYAERPLLDLRLQWPKFPLSNDKDGTIPEGTYVFPFHVQLPPSLPSSTYYPTDDNRSRSKMRFRIQYKLVATISESISKNMLSQQPNKAVKYLWIAAAAPDPPPPVTPCLVQPVAQQVKGGFLRGTGTFLFGAAVENCNLQAHAFIHLHVACRNDSSTPIQRVQIQVLERLQWGTAAVNRIDETTGTVRSSATLQQTGAIPLVTLRDIKLPGLTKERKGVLKSVMDSIMGSASQQQKLQRQVFDDLITGENLIRIQLPETVRESYAGQLLQVQHVARIEFQTGAFLKSPVVEIPLHITGHAAPQPPDDGGVVASSGAGKAYHVPTKPATTGIQATTNTNTTFGGNSPTAMAEPVATFESEDFGKGSGKKKKNAQQEIPMAEAVEIPDDAVEASTVITADVVVLGGDAVLREQASRRRLQNTTSLSQLVPLAPPSPSASLPTLLNEMKSSINDFELISQKLLDPQWVTLFQSLSPVEFGSIISCVHTAFDQPRVALLLAPHLHQGRGIQCVDVAAAVRNASEQYRAVMVQRLLPLCTDAKQNHALVRAELNEWEQTVANNVLEEATR